MFRYLFGKKEEVKEENHSDDQFDVSVAESVTAGALSNILCSEPGSSAFFKGGIVAYSIASKKELLDVDVVYAEKNNFANAFTTLDMAKQVCKKFKSRIGISTTGYSLPYYRAENPSTGECALNIIDPYVVICLYDAKLDFYRIETFEYKYDAKISKSMQRATVQSKASIEGRKMYLKYIEDNKKKQEDLSKSIIYLNDEPIVLKTRQNPSVIEYKPLTN
jgi:PncC family amidohydrolase